MSDTVTTSKTEDTVNNNTTVEQKPDDKQIKLNNTLKDKLRKYIKKLDGKESIFTFKNLIHITFN